MRGGLEGSFLSLSAPDSTRSCLFLSAELVRVHRFLQERGIAALAVKGPTLAMLAYGDLAGRPYHDLDFLVRPEDRDRVREELSRIGYRPLFTETGARLRAHRSTQCHDQFQHESSKVWLEVHWKLLPDILQVRFSEEDIWEGVQRVEIAGERIPTLPPETLALFLCAHGAKHLWCRREWLADVGGLVLRCPIDWDRVAGRARELGMERILRLAFLLVRGFQGVQIPLPLRQETEQDPAVRRLAGELRRQYVGCGYDPIGFRKTAPFYFRMRERWVDRLRDGWSHLRIVLTPTEREWDRLLLPDLLFFLYYVIRPLLWLARRSANALHCSAGTNRR